MPTMPAGDAIHVPMPEVDGYILQKIVEYCKKHVGDEPIKKKEDDEEEEDTSQWEEDEVVTLDPWDADFIMMEKIDIFELIRAANYMGIQGLEDLGTYIIAQELLGMSTEQIREAYNIEDLPLQPSETPEFLREENIIHFGVNCDGCQAHSFKGRRYKCEQCNDFDYCEGCYKAWQSNPSTHTKDHAFKQVQLD